MKRKLFLPVVAAFLLFLGYGCSDDGLTNREVQQMIDDSLTGMVAIDQFNVAKNEWRWDENNSEWYVYKTTNKLDKRHYEEGIIEGYLFVAGPNQNELQGKLPYIDTYMAKDQDDNPITFTETISMKVELGTPSRVGFFIKDSQLAKDDNAPRDCSFRVVLLW